MRPSTENGCEPTDEQTIRLHLGKLERLSPKRIAAGFIKTREICSKCKQGRVVSEKNVVPREQLWPIYIVL